MNRQSGSHLVNKILAVEARETILHEPLDEQGNGRLFVEPSAHEVVQLIHVNRRTGGPVSGSDFVSKHFEFGDGFGPSFVGQQEILEHLTCIAVVGSFRNTEQARGDGVRLIVARCVNAEG